LKTTRVDAQQKLAASGVVAEPTAYSPIGLRIASRPMLARHPLLVEGAIEVRMKAANWSVI
jgi:16S rRNA (cytosine967-C5)-methyltransferase